MPHWRRLSPGSRPAQAWSAILVFLAASGFSLLPGIAASARTQVARDDADALRFARGLLDQRKYALAAEEYTRILKRSPGGTVQADARYGLANALLYQGKYRESKPEFEAFLTDAPRDPRVRTAEYRLGEICYLLGDYREARSRLEGFTEAAAGHAGLEMAWTYLGDSCFNLDDLPAAKRAYARAIADYPRGRLADRARYGMGRTLAGLGEIDQALELFRGLIEAGKAGWVDRSWLQVARIERGSGRDQRAIDAVTALERSAPDSPLLAEARFEQACALGRLGRGDEASALFKRLAGPGVPAALAAQSALEWAALELTRGRAAEARAILDPALERFGETPLAPALRYRLAEALVLDKKPGEAEAQFRAVARLSPPDAWSDDAAWRAARLALERGSGTDARKMLEDFDRRFPSSPLAPEAALALARAFVLEKQPAEAAKRLEALLATARAQTPERSPAPWVAAALYELAVIDRGLGKKQAADALLEELTRGADKAVAADAHYLLGESAVDNRQFAEAVPHLQAYLSARPDGEAAEFALARLALAQAQTGHDAEAARSLAELGKRFPRTGAHASASLALAERALAANHLAEAESAFRKVIAAGEQAGVDLARPAQPQAKPDPHAIDPEVVRRAWTGLGRALYRLKKPAEAAQALARAIPGGNAGSENRLALAAALESAGQNEQALAAYDAILQADPRALAAALAKARLLARVERPSDAAKAYESIAARIAEKAELAKLKLEPAALLGEWAFALLDAQDVNGADRVFQRILAEYPQSPTAVDARFNLAESANERGNHAEVIRLLAPLAEGESLAPAQGDAADAVNRRNEAILFRLGRAQAELRAWPSAARAFDRLLGAYPRTPLAREAKFFRALAHEEQGEFEPAATLYATVANDPPGKGDPPRLDTLARTRRLACLVGMKRWADVLTEADSLKPALGSDQRACAELDFARGQALKGQGRLADARSAFASVASQKTGDLPAQAQLMVGETYFHEGKFHEALREFLKVDILYKSPRWQAAALLEAGKVQERIDQPAEAAETYERLAARFPDDPVVKVALARKDALARKGSGNGKKRGS